MKTNFIHRFLPESTLVKKINKRHADMAKNVFIEKGLNPADAALIEKNQASLGRFAKRKGVKIGFSPSGNGDIFSSMKMSVYKDRIGLESGPKVKEYSFFNGEIEKELSPSIVVKRFQKGNTVPLDNTITNTAEKLENIKQHVIEAASSAKEKCFGVIKRIVFPE